MFALAAGTRISESDENSPSRARRVIEAVRELVAYFRSSGLESSMPEHPAATVDVALEPTTPRDEDCSVCLSPMSDGCVKTPCGHYFHDICLQQYFLVSHTARSRTRASCPLCRASLRAPLPVSATASSGRPIEVVGVPAVGELCHLDRDYAFRSLGDFARPRMLYLLTSNDDRKTPANRVSY